MACIPSVVQALGASLFFQVMAMVCVCVGYSVCSLYYKPWREELLNLVDAVVGFGLLGVLICGVVTTDSKYFLGGEDLSGSAQEEFFEDVGVVGCIVAIVVFGVVGWLTLMGRFSPKRLTMKVYSNESIASYDLWISYDKSRNQAPQAIFYREFLNVHYGLKSKLSYGTIANMVKNIHDVSYECSALAVLCPLDEDGSPSDIRFLYNFDILAEVMVAYIFGKPVVFIKSTEKDVVVNKDFFHGLSTRVTPEQDAMLTAYRISVAHDAPLMFKELLSSEETACVRLSSKSGYVDKSKKTENFMKRTLVRASTKNSSLRKSITGETVFKASEGEIDDVTTFSANALTVPIDNEVCCAETGRRSSVGGDGVIRLMTALNFKQREDHKKKRFDPCQLSSQITKPLLILADLGDQTVKATVACMQLNLGGYRHCRVLDPSIDTDSIISWTEHNIILFVLSKNMFKNVQYVEALHRLFEEETLSEIGLSGAVAANRTSEQEGNCYALGVTVDLMNYDRLAFFDGIIFPGGAGITNCATTTNYVAIQDKEDYVAIKVADVGKEHYVGKPSAQPPQATPPTDNCSAVDTREPSQDCSEGTSEPVALDDINPDTLLVPLPLKSIDPDNSVDVLFRNDEDACDVEDNDDVGASTTRSSDLRYAAHNNQKLVKIMKRLQKTQSVLGDCDANTFQHQVATLRQTIAVLPGEKFVAPQWRNKRGVLTKLL